MDWVNRTPALFQAKAPLVGKAPFSKTTRETWPEYQGNPRLGFLYQYLCAQLFTATPYYNAVSEEIQLIDEGKTIGSLDFLAKNRKTEHYEHWEVAIKFYLLHQRLWYGLIRKIAWISSSTICSTTNSNCHRMPCSSSSILCGLVHHNICSCRVASTPIRFLMNLSRKIVWVIRLMQTKFKVIGVSNTNNI